MATGLSAFLAGCKLIFKVRSIAKVKLREHAILCQLAKLMIIVKLIKFVTVIFYSLVEVLYFILFFLLLYDI